MIQFNLLPKVKLDYVRAKRNKRLTIVISLLVSGSALAIMLLLFVGVRVVQKKYSNDLSRDIKQQTSKLEGTQDINKILTIQNQLNSLTSLHDQKPAAQRLFDFMGQITPSNVSVATVNIDFTGHTMNINGSANSISSVNTFVDTIKFTTYEADGSSSDTNAFSDVVLASFGKDDKGSSYQITLTFDPTIFDNTKQIKLTVPAGKITTRSETEKPDSLFQPLSNKGSGQ
jgi:hypothetical protein